MPFCPEAAPFFLLFSRAALLVELGVEERDPPAETLLLAPARLELAFLSVTGLRSDMVVLQLSEPIGRVEGETKGG